MKRQRKDYLKTTSLKLDVLNLNKKHLIDLMILFTVATFQFIDFFFTWYGVNTIGIITEGNPLMVWVLNLTFYPALLFRFLLIGSVMGMLIFLRSLDRKSFVIVGSIGCVINIGMFIYHLTFYI